MNKISVQRTINQNLTERLTRQLVKSSDVKDCSLLLYRYYLYSKADLKKYKQLIIASGIVKSILRFWHGVWVTGTLASSRRPARRSRPTAPPSPPSLLIRRHQWICASTQHVVCPLKTYDLRAKTQALRPREGQTSP